MATLDLHVLTDRRAFCDPAGGRANTNAKYSRSAIVCVGRDRLGRLFVLQAIAARWSTDELIEKIFEVNDLWHPKEFGVEASAQQGLFVDALQSVARLRAKRINVVPVKQPTTMRKDFRIRTRLQPAVADGKIFLQADQVELRTEIVGHPTAQTNDLVDALASAVSMFPPQTTQAERRQADSQYIEFLRDSGLPKDYVDKRSKEIYAEDSVSDDDT